MGSYTNEAEEILRNYANKIPVPLIEITKKLGIKVHLTSDFDDKKSGQIQWVDGVYHIYLNANHSPARNRFTLAHEIGHYLLHRNFLDLAKGLADYEGRTVSLARETLAEPDQREYEANCFAADLLMPQDKFVEVWNSTDYIDEVADIFEVSKEAASIRASAIRRSLASGDPKKQ